MMSLLVVIETILVLLLLRVLKILKVLLVRLLLRLPQMSVMRRSVVRTIAPWRITVMVTIAVIIVSMMVMRHGAMVRTTDRRITDI
jgi:hypothetical protein